MKLKSRMPAGQTLVPNEFIDHYLSKASGEFVKVYLCLLRLQAEPDLQVSTLADMLDVTEKDICRALRYWDKQGLIKLVCNTQEEMVSLTILAIPEQEEPEETSEQRENGEAKDRPASPHVEIRKADEEGTLLTAALTEAQEPAAARNEAQEPAAAPFKGTAQAQNPQPAQRHSTSPSQLMALKSGDKAFEDLLVFAELPLGRTLSTRDTDLLAYLYADLGMSAELLEYLVDYCATSGHPNLKYMESVALSWHRQGIRTVRDAKEETQHHSSLFRQIEKDFGIRGRSLGASEIAFVERWTREMGFSEDVIHEACLRANKKSASAPFPFANAILESWSKAGVKAVTDIAAAEAQGSAAKAARKGRTEPVQASFNFDQRRIDFDALLAAKEGN